MEIRFGCVNTRLGQKCLPTFKNVVDVIGNMVGCGLIYQEVCLHRKQRPHEVVLKELYSSLQHTNRNRLSIEGFGNKESRARKQKSASEWEKMGSYLNTTKK